MHPLEAFMIGLAVTTPVMIGISLIMVMTRALGLASQLAERWFLLQETNTTKNTVEEKNDPLPQDLWLSATRWSEEWAREDQLRRMRELYREYGDWDRVRAIISAQPQSSLE